MRQETPARNTQKRSFVSFFKAKQIVKHFRLRVGLLFMRPRLHTNSRGTLYLDDPPFGRRT